MAHNVSGASLTPIYERLNGVANYHPLDAETFADWSTEAGDIVTVTRDGKEYSTPIHTSSFTWRGKAPVMTINATGNQNRDPVSKIAKRKYGGGGAGMRNDQTFISELTSEDGTLHSLIYQTTTYIMTAVDDTKCDLHSQIVQTASMIESSVATAESNMYSVIQQTATVIYTGVYDDLNGNFATIVQTSTMIATAVVSANSSIYSTIQQTSTSIMTEVGKRNRVFVQLTDPALTVSDLHDGDIWVQSSGVRTWNQVAQKVWSAIGDMAWRQLYGSVWYVRKNNAWEKNMDESAVIEQRVRIEHNEDSYAILASELDSTGNRLDAKIQVTASQIESTASAARSTLYSVIRQTATNIMSTVANTKSELSTQIEQTASEIVSTASAARSSLYTIIRQTATNVFSGVYDKVANNFSTIEQTATAITSAVTSASSSLYTTIQQTSTSIMTEVGKRNRVFVQLTDPALTVSDLHDGDIWVQSSGIRTWSQVAQNAWSSVGDKLWRQLYGSVWYVRKNNAWEKNMDEAAVIEQRVRIEHNEDSYAILGHQLDTLGQSMDTKLQVTASKIESTASAARSTLYSVIRQTATNIMSTVANTKSELSTQIEQTASEIVSTASAARSSLYTVIRQTSTNVFSGVYNKVSNNFSTIEQTASQISTRVGKGEVISSINQTAESVTINASKINLSGYVKATDLTANYIAGILVDSSVLSTNYIFTKSLEIGTGGATINGYSCALEDGIKALQITQSGDTYTLQKKHFYSLDWSTVGTFSRATTLTGAWGGTVAAGKYFKVTASPQGNECYSKQLDGMSTRNDKTWASDKKSFTQTLYVYDEDGVELYEENKSFDTTDSYNAGKADLTWSYGSASHSNSAPSSYAKKYEVDASYRYWYFNVTVNGVSKRILLDVLGAI